MEFDSWKKTKNESPIDNFLEDLVGAHLAWILKKVDYYLALTFSEMVEMDFIDKSTGDLWELKFKCPKKFFPVRMFFAFRGDKYLLLHVFPKKYNGAIRQKEINQALINLKLLDSDKENQKINSIKI